MELSRDSSGNQDRLNDSEIDNDKIKTVLEDSLLFKSLSQVLNTGGGYAYTKLVCREKEIDIISPKLSQYTYLQIIDLSFNQIIDIQPILQLPNVKILDLSNNRIGNIDNLALPSCEILNVGHNQIKSIDKLTLPALKRLCIDGNPIETIQHIPSSISHLSVKNCQTLTKFSVIDSEMTALYLSNTPLESLECIGDISTLETLDITSVPFQDWGLMTSILKKCTALTEICIDAPADAGWTPEELKIELLIQCKELKWINGVQVEDIDHIEAFELQKQRLANKAEENGDENAEENLEED